MVSDEGTDVRICYGGGLPKVGTGIGEATEEGNACAHLSWRWLHSVGTWHRSGFGRGDC